MENGEKNSSQNQPREDEVNTLTLLTENENDGKIVIRFAANNLEVWGDFIPNKQGGSPVNQNYASELLKKFNIVYGIRQEEIENAINVCANENKIIKNICIARGDPPLDERLEYMQLNPLLGRLETPEKDGDTVDHRARSPFVIVKKGDALAKQKSRKPGKDGKNVRGEAIGFGIARPEGVEGGENTRMNGSFLVSDISGQMIVAKKVVSVKDSLVIKGAVGYGTGNINFPGNVMIEGPVSDGFKIISGGSVTIKQTFDLTEAVTKEDLNVAGGIIGRGPALVKVGGNLKTKFIENCRVACRKTVWVDTEIINSNIFTLEMLDMGDKGRLVGGEIYAVKGLRAGGIGRKGGKAASIHCGVDFTVLQEKEKNNGLLRILSAKLSRIRELMKNEQYDDEKKAKMEVLLHRLENEQQKTQAKVSSLLGRLNTCANAAVEVSGEIMPGTVIEICQAVLNITTTLKKVRIYLDKENGAIVTESLQAKGR